MNGVLQPCKQRVRRTVDSPRMSPQKAVLLVVREPSENNTLLLLLLNYTPTHSLTHPPSTSGRGSASITWAVVESGRVCLGALIPPRVVCRFSVVFCDDDDDAFYDVRVMKKVLCVCEWRVACGTIMMRDEWDVMLYQNVSSWEVCVPGSLVGWIRQVLARRNVTCEWGSGRDDWNRLGGDRWRNG